jgi:hypothetical protein
MKQFSVVAVLVFFGAGAWYVGSRLSSDAIGMALGVMFGVVATLPVALIVLAVRRRSHEDEESARAPGPSGGYSLSRAPQPPVIIVTGPGFQQQGSAPVGYLPHGEPTRLALPDLQAQKPGRAFRMVGEKDEWIEEF